MWQRIKDLLRGAASIFVSGLDKKTPGALHEQEQRRLRAQMAKDGVRRNP